jgi:hypothetical protein
MLLQAQVGPEARRPLVLEILAEWGELEAWAASVD